MSDIRRFLRSLLVPAASIALLATGTMWANSMFVGITGIETRPGQTASVQVVEFHADLPFYYQMQLLDKDHVVLRLYNVQIAENLLTSEGSINMLTGGAVQSAMLKQPPVKKLVTEAYREIILTGPGLGTKTIQVTGAKPLPLSALSAQLPSTKSKTNKAGRSYPNLADLERQWQSQELAKDNPSLVMMALANQNGPTAGTTQTDSRIEIEESSKRKPQIESVMNVSGAPTYAPRPTAAVKQSSEAFTSSQTVYEQVTSNTVSVPQTSTEAAPPEPGYQVMMPLPRYQGGAAPIKAVTLDGNGRPILIQPKNAPIAEYEVGSTNGGYNTLFQEESAELTENDQVDQRMADALTAYQSGRYEQALSQVKQALTINEKNADLYAALAEIQLKLKQTEQASTAYEKAQALEPGKYNLRYAQVLVLAGKRPTAIHFLESLYQRDPKQAQIVYMLGTLQEEAGNTPKALSYLKQAAELHPGSADIQYNLGLAYEFSGDWEQAELHYRKALSLNPGAKDITTALERVRG
jgi:Flp pilus assembly protein TadD